METSTVSSQKATMSLHKADPRICYTMVAKKKAKRHATVSKVLRKDLTSDSIKDRSAISFTNAATQRGDANCLSASISGLEARWHFHVPRKPIHKRESL